MIKKGAAMHGTIAYSPKHVYHIKKILTSNLVTIQGLVKMIEDAGPHWSMDETLKDARVPPGQELKKGDKCFITEGIFHAIALEQTGKKVAAAISSSNFPSNLIESHK
jgi:hypothetical protein